MPISEVLLRGSAPNIFMSRAESHEVGGGRPDSEAGGGEGGGVGGREWKDRGAGDGDCLSLSFIVILVRCAVEGLQQERVSKRSYVIVIGNT
jgi:hypothetical protein